MKGEESVRTPMRIAVIGSGYVGTTLAAGFADMNHDVTAVDIDEAIVKTLNAGESPIHEPGLGGIIARTAGESLTATTDYTAITDAQLVFIAVQTPTTADGSINTDALRAATIEAVDTLVAGSERPDGHVIVIKSTVTPPKLAALREDVESRTSGSDIDIELASNPEFLREGSAVADFSAPDKIVFGIDSKRAGDWLEQAFEPIIATKSPDVIRTDPETASMIKYANNAFLAAKISVINDIGNICKEFGIDAYVVAEAIGTDHRISPEFLRSGVGFGGSCFPKDVRALIAEAAQAGYHAPLLDATVELNEEQPTRMVSLLEKHLNPAGARVAVLGLAFKPGTDDIRNSRSIPLIEALKKRGAQVVAYDPVATPPMRERFPEIEYANSAAGALDGADAALVMTAWDEFGALDTEFDTMTRPIVVDGRRIIERRDGITYEGLTW